MPTRRRKIPPKRINEPVPAWAARLLAGERPQAGDDGHDEFIGWLYLNDTVQGLPDPPLPEGRPLWSVCRAH